MNRDWMQDALCTTTDPEVFFPQPPDGIRWETGARERKAAVKRATRVCQACHVKAECLNYGMTLGITTGIWGGVDFDDSRLLRIRLRQQRRKTA